MKKPKYPRAIRIPRKIHTTEAEKIEHLAAIREAFATRTEQDEKLTELFLRNISTIDIKAQSMLAFNSLIIASETIIYATTERPTVKVILALSFMLILYSSLKALMVLNFEVGTTENFRNFQQMELGLLELRNRRAHDFQILRFSSFLAFLGFAIALLASFILD
ncbi:MAG: hypothetical protein ORO03_05255 [Alphaproteobacteria bacterium]|nr:hypothetical protein [Alphaproteobacteria bacterium]